MKTRTGLALALAAALAGAAPQTLQLARKYAVGELDAYRMKMTMKGQMEVEMSMDLSQKVTKVYDNGDADIESTMSGGKVNAMGREMPIPAGKANTTRISKYGEMVGSKEAPKGMGGMDFTKYLRQMPKEGLTVGQTIKIAESDPTDQKVKIAGSYTLESVVDGIAKVRSVMDVSSEKATRPVHIEFETLIEAATGRMNRTEGKITNPQALAGMPAGMAIEGITILMERKA